MAVSVSSLPAAQAGTITLGGDLTVNRMGYGAMRITGKGIWGPPDDVNAALATLRRAVELGVNFIDTADSYGPDVSEELIAQALFPYPAGLVVATKAGWTRFGPGVWQHDASPAHLEKAIEGSLKRLRLDRIDVYQLHVPDPAVSFDASMETLARLKEQGKIRHVALSNVTLEHIKRAESCPHRQRTESLQLLGSRVGFRGGLLRGQRDCVSALGTDGASAQGERGGGKNRRRAKCIDRGRLAGMAAAALASHFADSRDQLCEAP